MQKAQVLCKYHIWFPYLVPYCKVSFVKFHIAIWGAFPRSRLRYPLLVPISWVTRKPGHAVMPLPSQFRNGLTAIDGVAGAQNQRSTVG